MAARTASSNPAARAAIAVGLVAVAAVPAGVVVSRYDERVTLVYGIAGGAVCAAILGIAALALARRARTRLQRTLGRAGGAVAARIGRAFGVLGFCAGLTAALALAFFGLLRAFAT